MEYLADNMLKCKAFVARFCDITMCYECGMLDRNLAVEYHKRHDICLQCHGMEIFSSFIHGASVSRICNQCGGTGRFHIVKQQPKKERFAMMRAKMKVVEIEKHEGHQNVRFSAVSRPEGYPADGTDENNTFAKWTPSAELKMTITNPALFDKMTEGEEYYLDFTKA